MKTFTLAAAIAALTLSTAAAQAKLPGGWQMRTDDGGTEPKGVQFMTMGTGVHVMSGPAAIFYRPDMTKSGSYQVQATFNQMEPAEHPEGYGLIIGGSNLSSATQKYTYFLVRQDGQFLIKRRAGDTTPTVKDWTANGAVKKTDATTKGVNTLAIAVAPDKVRFLVNGTEVAAAPASQIDTSGIVGLRINHNLNVHVDQFGVK
jgi:hypothetical protein